MPEIPETYTEIYDKIYGSSDPHMVEIGILALLPGATRKAWKIIQALYGRKGFEWWWKDIGSATKDDIFEEIRRTIL